MATKKYLLAGRIVKDSVNKKVLINGRIVKLTGGTTGPSTQNLTVTAGIASTNAFGTADLTQPAATQNLTVTAGIASTNAFGTADLTQPSVAQNLTVTAGIASTNAFGTADLTQPSVAQNLTVTAGIASTNAFGTAQADLNLIATGIASTNAFGTAQVDLGLTATGIASTNAFGTAQADLNLIVTGLASTNAFGKAQAVFATIYYRTSAKALLEPNLTSPGTKPIGPVEVDWNNSITNGLRAVMLASESPVELVKNRKSPDTGTIVTSNEGRVFAASSTVPTPVEMFAEDAVLDAGGEISVLVRFRYNSASPGKSNYFLGRWNTAAGAEQFWIGGTYADLSTENNPSFGVIDTSGTYHGIADIDVDMVEGEWYTVLGVIGELTPGAGVGIFGKPEYGYWQVSEPGVQSVEGLGVPVLASARDYTAGNSADGELAFGYIWNRVITTQEREALFADPYSILKPAALVDELATFAVIPKVVLYPNGLASTNVFGTADATLAFQLLEPSSIVNTNAFGTAQVDLGLTATGIASTNAFGTAQVDLNLTAIGIASTNVFGTADLTQAPAAQQLTVTAGIASTNAFGTAQADLNLTATGIASTTIFGTADLIAPFAPQTLTVTAGIASTNAFGTAQANLNVTATGITSNTVFGTASIGLNLKATGVVNTVSFGTADLSLNLSVTGLPHTNIFGTAQVVNSTLYPVGIPSTNAFGFAQLSQEQFLTVTAGIPSTVVFGKASILETDTVGSIAISAYSVYPSISSTGVSLGHAVDTLAVNLYPSIDVLTVTVSE